MARLLSVNVGLPQDIAWRGRTVRTGIWKTRVKGPRFVRRLNIDGDGQGDLIGHGGEQRAVLVYQISNYPYWEGQLHRSDFTFGQFGENFTVEGLADDEVCIGDRYRIGSALFEVTQPRVTCYRVGIRMDEPRMAALLVSHHRPGFYCRVLQEGWVEAGNEIVKIGYGAEHMTVRETDQLLYLPGHPREQVERALRIPALSVGWQESFRALLARDDSLAAQGGNPGLAPALGPSPAWTGFRNLGVSRIDRESSDVISLTLESADAEPLAVPRPGQFIVMRLPTQSGAVPLLRTYSLSGPPEAGYYRVSVKREPNGTGSRYLHEQLQVGAFLEVAAPRGNFLLRPDDGPIVLLSAGVGATPTLAFLYALAARRSQRPVFWIYGARNGDHHPFRDEVRRLLALLPHANAHISYSRPRDADRLGEDYDAPGHVTIELIEELGIPRAANFYLCGPAGFLSDLSSGLRKLKIAAEQMHTEVFGSGESLTPGLVKVERRRPHAPALAPSAGPAVSFARSEVTTRWDRACSSLLEFAEACDVPVRWACRTGVCHTCESALVAGAVVYDPEPLEPPAAGNVLICCAQPEGDVVLDL